MIGSGALETGELETATLPSGSEARLELSPMAPMESDADADLRWERLRWGLSAGAATAPRSAPPSTVRASPRANPVGASSPCPWVSGASAIGAGAAPARSARNGGIGAISGGAPTVVPSAGSWRHACGPVGRAAKTSPVVGAVAEGCGLLNGQGNRM